MVVPHDSSRTTGSERAFAAQSKYLERTNSSASLRSINSSLSRSPSKLDSAGSNTPFPSSSSPELPRKWIPAHRSSASIDQIQRRFGGAPSLSSSPTLPPVTTATAAATSTTTSSSAASFTASTISSISSTSTTSSLNRNSSIRSDRFDWNSNKSPLSSPPLPPAMPSSSTITRQPSSSLARERTRSSPNAAPSSPYNSNNNNNSDYSKFHHRTYSNSNTPTTTNSPSRGLNRAASPLGPSGLVNHARSPSPTKTIGSTTTTTTPAGTPGTLATTSPSKFQLGHKHSASSSSTFNLPPLHSVKSQEAKSYSSSSSPSSPSLSQKNNLHSRLAKYDDVFSSSEEHENTPPTPPKPFHYSSPSHSHIINHHNNTSERSLPSPPSISSSSSRPASPIKRSHLRNISEHQEVTNLHHHDSSSSNRDAPSTPTTPKRTNSMIGSPRIMPKTPVDSNGKHWRNIPPESPEIGGDEVVGLPGRVKLTRRPQSTSNFANELKQLNLQREHIKAYEYLCHVGEAQQWVDNCLQAAGETEIVTPGGVTGQSVVELEQNLRDGVILAHLARAFEGSSFVPRIFTSSKLEYRHTDNLYYFFKFLDHVGLPTNFHFETIDCYDGKNMPKVFYCIHSLSHHLARQGRADPVQKLWGHLQFTDEQLDQAGRGIAGVHMPDFNSVGKALAKELKEEEPVETEEEIMQRKLNEAQDAIIGIQALARKSIDQINHAHNINQLRRKHAKTWINLQALSRAKNDRQQHLASTNSIFRSQRQAIKLQSLVRGNLVRHQHSLDKHLIDRQQIAIVKLQSATRGSLVRRQYDSNKQIIYNEQDHVVQFQSLVRASLARWQHNEDMMQLYASSYAITGMQSIARKRFVRQDLISMIRNLTYSLPNLVLTQALARGHLIRSRRAAQQKVIKSHQVEHSVVSLQNITRAKLTNKLVKDQTKSFHDVTPQIIQFQALTRATLARWNHYAWLHHLRVYEPTILWLQCHLRGLMAKRTVKSRWEHYLHHMDKVVKVQSVMRAKQQGEQYRQLRRGKNVPMSTIKNFIHLLDDSDYDYQEEIELEKLRREIVHKIRENEALEAHVNDLDIKIALLVKNKITLDEVNRVRRGNFSSTSEIRNSVLKANNDPFALGNVDKKAHERLELYQELFYLLQTKPDYLAKLFCKIGQQAFDDPVVDKQRKDLEKMAMTLFGYCQNTREEFLLLKLLQRSLHEELLSVGQVQDFIRSNFLFMKLFVRYGRGEKERKYIKNFLAPNIQQVIDANDLDLETDPTFVYKSLINAEEERTGVKSQRRPNPDAQTALTDGETRAAFIRNLQRLRAFSDMFLNSMFGVTARIPFGVRYMLREIFRALKAKFPDQEEGAILKVVGHLYYYRFVHPAIMAPESFDITKQADEPLQRKNLSEISKMLNQISVGRLFSQDHPYLQPLNVYVAEATQKFTDWTYELINVDNAEDVFNADEFLDHSGAQRPVIYISPNEIYAMHDLVVKNLSAVAPPVKHGEQDALRAVLQGLGGVPHAASPELDNARSGDVSLTLKPRGPSVPDTKSEQRALFAKTKRYVMAILKVEPGQDLLDVLSSKVIPEQEELWWRVVEVEKQAAQKRKHVSSPLLSNKTAMDDVYELSFAEIKARVIEGIMQLEAAGLVKRENKFQDLLNSVAIDIRNKHQKRIRREIELTNMNNTMTSLDNRKEYLDDQIRQYGSYIESSMATMQRKGKKKLVIPFSPQYFHLRDLEKKGKVPQFGSYKYTAQKLQEKGVLLSLDDKWSRENYTQVTISVSSDTVGVFDFSINNPGFLSNDKTEVRMEDLLNKQFNNESSFEIKNIATCNLNLLLHLVNRKFYR